MAMVLVEFVSTLITPHWKVHATDLNCVIRSRMTLHFHFCSRHTIYCVTTIHVIDCVYYTSADAASVSVSTGPQPTPTPNKELTGLNVSRTFFYVLAKFSTLMTPQEVDGAEFFVIFFAEIPFPMKSCFAKITDFGQKPWTIVKRFD